MPSILVRLLLFLSSYFPLAMIFFVLFVQKNRSSALAVLVVGVLGLVGMLVYLWTATTLSPFPVKVQHLQRRDSEAMSYVVSYLVPFLSIPFSGWQQGVALSIFFLMLSILYINSGMIHINPMLNLLGYKIYEIEDAEGGTHAVVSRRRISRGETLSVIKIDEDILLIAKP